MGKYNIQQLVMQTVGLIVSGFIRIGQPYIIKDEQRCLNEAMTLFAKQTNLLESIQILLDQNMAEEAYILFRSQLNNYMLIMYLCEDKDGTRYNNYLIQPIKSRLKFLKNFQDLIKNDYFEDSGELITIEREIKELDEILNSNGYTKNKTKLLTMSELSKTNVLTAKAFAHLYNDASRYEHSDPSVLNTYREQNENDHHFFKLTLTRSDFDLGNLIRHMSPAIYFSTYDYLLKYIDNNFKELLSTMEQSVIFDINVNILLFHQMSTPVKQ